MSAAAHPDSPTLSDPAIGVRGWMLIVGISLAALAEAVASTALSTGRLDMIGDTHATPDEFAWLDVAYTAAKFSAFLLAPWLAGRLLMVVALRASIGLLALVSGLAAVTTDLDLLSAVRLLQGFAGGLLLVCGQTVLFQSFCWRWQPFVQSVFAIGAVVAPAAAIPLLSGWMIDNWAWNWIFLSTFAIAVLALALAVGGGSLEGVTVSKPALDWLGFMLLLLSAFALTYVFNQGSRWNWFEEGRVLVLATIGASALSLLVILISADRKGQLLDRSIFQYSNFTFAFLASFVAGAALSGTAYLIPSFAVSVLGMTATEAGWLLLPSGLLFVTALFLAAILIDKCRLPPIATVPFGVLAFMAAMWMLSQSTAESGVQDMALPVLIRGLGLGFLFLSLTLVAFEGMPRHLLIHGVALFNVGRLAGGLMGVAGLQTLIDHRTAQSLAVLAANLTAGRPAVVDRIAQLGSHLAAKGLAPEAATKTSINLLGRQVATQATVLSFDAAFLGVITLFVAAAPILVACRIILARTARDRVKSVAEHTGNSAAL